MKTNQLMRVKINSKCIIRIGHKNLMGRVESILDYCNLKRSEKGLRRIELNDILRKSEFWEFVIARNTQNFVEQQKKSLNGKFPIREINQIESDYSILNEYKDKKGQIKYSELSKQFKNLIKIQRGGKPENRGYWFDLYILLKIASMLDKDLEVQIYDVFIKGRILENRDKGGESFKLLMSHIKKELINPLSDKEIELELFINDGYLNHYLTVSKWINEKVNESYNEGWNNKDNKEQEVRDLIHNKLITLIEFKVITDLASLKEALDKIEI